MKLFILLTILLLAPVVVFAHPGGLNYESCHYCRTNCEEKWGISNNDYHCHAGGDTSVYTAPAAEEPATAPEEQSELEPEPTVEPEPEPEKESVSTPEPVSETANTDVTTQEKPQTEEAPDATVSEEPQENAGVETGVKPEEANADDVQGATAASEDVTEPEEASAGEALLGFALLGAMGYGGYRGVKAVVKKIHKK